MSQSSSQQALQADAGTTATGGGTAASTAVFKRPRKRQADRLLKQLPLSDRRRQNQIRQQISYDLQYASV